MDESIAVNTGHIGVDLRDNNGCLLRYRFYDVHADPEAQVAPRRHGVLQSPRAALVGAATTEPRFSLHAFISIPDGVEHIHFNDTEEPLFLLWAYAPPGVLPTK